MSGAYKRLKELVCENTYDPMLNKTHKKCGNKGSARKRKDGKMLTMCNVCFDKYAMADHPHNRERYGRLPA